VKILFVMIARDYNSVVVTGDNSSLKLLLCLVLDPPLYRNVCKQQS